MEMILRRIEDGEGRAVDLDLLVDVSDGISIDLAWPPKMTTICPLGPSAVSPIIALRDYFRDEVHEHVARGGCWFPGARVSPNTRESASGFSEGDRPQRVTIGSSGERGSGGRPPERIESSNGDRA